jgi:hypothetical protein
MAEGDSPKAKSLLLLLLAASVLFLFAAAIALTTPSRTTHHRIQFLAPNNLPAFATYTAGTNHTFRYAVPMNSQRLDKAMVWLNRMIRLPLFKKLTVYQYSTPSPALCVFVCSKNGAILPQFDVSLVSPLGLPTICNHFSTMGASCAYIFPESPSNLESFTIEIADGTNQLTKFSLEK